jgi:hypothetical protein
MAKWYKRVIARPAWREVIVRENRMMQTRMATA